MCAKVKGQCLEYLGRITLTNTSKVLYTERPFLGASKQRQRHLPFWKEKKCKSINISIKRRELSIASVSPKILSIFLLVAWVEKDSITAKLYILQRIWLISINLSKKFWVVTWTWLSLTSEVVEAVPQCTFCPNNSMFGSSHSANSAYQRFTKKWDQL